MTDDLVAFLKARLDEDEQVATAASVHGDRWETGSPSGVWPENDPENYGTPIVYDEGYPLIEQAQHIARWDPSRVLAEVQAKRRIIERHHEVIWTEWHDVRETACGHCSQPGGRRVAWPCPDVLDIAEVYGWAPEELA